MNYQLSNPTPLCRTCICNGVIILSVILFLSEVAFCTPSSLRSGDGEGDYTEFPTEPPDLVEILPEEWLSGERVVAQQVSIEVLKLETQVKLRYARTRVSINLRNQHDRELPADFTIQLTENALFTMFQMKKGSGPKILKKDDARNIFHFAKTKTNGTVSAGYIELSSRDATGSYNLKFTIAAREIVQAYLVYERQLDRISNVYSDKIQVFPSNPLFNSSKIRLVEFAVDVEELERIQWLRCANETEEHFSNCRSRSRKTRKRNGKRKFIELTWRERDVTTERLKQHPFQFDYELEQRNDTTTAVLISQHNGNYYFVHLFVPENLPIVRKHILFLLDVSDSMHGKKLEQLQWSMLEILDDLGPQDFFNIIAFSNDINIWSKFRGDMGKCPFPFPATEEFKDSAVQFIQEKLIAHGTTNIYQGLSTAFDLVRLFSPNTNDTCSKLGNIKSPKLNREKVNEKLPKNVDSTIFFLSDGKATSGPTDSARLLIYFRKLYHDTTGTSSPVQINTISFGAYADFKFLKALSRMNGGVNKIILEESAAGIELVNFYQEISSQVLSHVETSLVATDNGTNVASQINSPVTLIKGSEILTTGQLFPKNRNENQSFSVGAFNWSTEGIGRDGKLAFYNSPVYDCTTLDLSIGKCVDRIDFYLERLQAYQLLKKLLERDKMVQNKYICPQAYHDEFQDLKNQRLLNYDYEDVEGEDQNCYNNFKQQATELALKHKFVTPYTSFILTTEQIDNGLKISDQLIPDSSSSNEDSYEHVLKPRPAGNREKLILMGSVSHTENLLLQKPSSAPQYVTESKFPEIMPTAIPQVERMTENYGQDNLGKDSVAFLGAAGFLNRLNLSTNSTAAASENLSGLKLFTQSMRDFVVKTFRKLFQSS